MTPAERAFLARMERRARLLRPDLARRQIQAYELIRGALNERELIRAIRSGHVEALIDLLLDEQGTLDPALAPLRARLDQALMESARLQAQNDLPSFLRPTAFNVLSPAVVDAARQLDTKVIQGLKDNVRATFLQTVTRGIEDGLPPRTIARRARSLLDLAPNQEAAVANFRRMLEEGDREALTRKLRDRRFDSVLNRALGADGEGLSGEQVDRMVRSYHRRMVAFNAETHARTAALDAQRFAQRAAWEDAIERGVLERGDLRRTWLAVGGPHGDGRNRQAHLEMHKKTVRFDERYFPIDQLVPGEDEYRCRCVERIWVVAASLRRAA